MGVSPHLTWPGVTQDPQARHRALRTPTKTHTSP